MDSSTAPSAAADAPETSEERLHEIEQEAEEHAKSFLHHAKAAAIAAFEVGRFFLFILYALLAIIGFWLWAATGLLVLLRLLLKLITTPLLWLADGPPRGPKGKKRGVAEAMAIEARLRWQRREDFRKELSTPLARAYLTAQRVVMRFWHFSMPRKAVIITLGFFLVFVPGMFVVPRTNYVKITDDNAINHSEDGTRVEYLIHAVDMYEAGKTREYHNENMWYFGKINAQGMKNRITPGKYYKVWIVGLRWYFPPIFPNIIDVEEIDEQGNPIDE